MSQSRPTLSPLTVKTLDQIRDHFQAADGVRPSLAGTIARVSTLFLRQIQAGQLTQETLATRYTINEPRDD